jgi:hypothetical protein
MGFNVAGLHVRVRPGLTQELLVATVSGFWLGRDAQLSSRDPLQFEPLAVRETGLLGFAVSPITPDAKGREWIAVYDSERYTADSELAEHLAITLDTDVWLVEVADVVNHAEAIRFGTRPRSIRNYGKAFRRAEGFPYGLMYYNQLKDAPDALVGFELLAFEQIPARKTGYSGPDREQLDSLAQVAHAQARLNDGDLAAVVSLAATPQVLAEVIVPAVEKADPTDPASRRLLRTFWPLVRGEVAGRTNIAEAALRDRDEQWFDEVIAAFPHHGYGLERRALELLDEPRLALGLIEARTRLPGVELTTWNNAIHLLDRAWDDPGLPSERIAAVVDAAAAAAPQNPSIFHNLACVMVKQGDLERALHWVQEAVRFGYAELDRLRQDPDLARLRTDPRFAQAFGASPASGIRHLSRGEGSRSVVPAIGVHLLVAGLVDTEPLAALIRQLHDELPEMFAHYLPSGAFRLEPAKAGRVARVITSLSQHRNPPRVYFNAAPSGEGCDHRLMIDIDSEVDDLQAEITIELPLTLAESPDLLDKLLSWVEPLPVVTGRAGYSLVPSYTGNGCSVWPDVRTMLAVNLAVSTSYQSLHESEPALWVMPSLLTLLGPGQASLVDRSALPEGVERPLPHGGVALLAGPSLMAGIASDQAGLGYLPQIAAGLKRLRPFGRSDFEVLEQTRFDALVALAERGR